LKVLEQAGLIARERDANRRPCRLVGDALIDVVHWAEHTRRAWEERLDLEIVPNERIVSDHGRDQDNDPDRFRVTVTFDEQADKKTVVTMRSLLPTIAARGSS